MPTKPSGKAELARQQEIAALTQEQQAEMSAEEQELLDFLGLSGKEGKENITSDDIVIPRIAIMQALSPQVKERTAQMGDIVNIVTGENYTKGSAANEAVLHFIPLLFFGNRIKWESPNPGSPIECIAKDGEHGSKYGECRPCVFKEFTTNNTNGKNDQPLCTEFKNIMIIPLPSDSNPYDQAPAAFSGKRASLGAMKQFLTQVTALRYNGREVPMYAHRWAVRSVEVSNAAGSFYVPKFEDLGMITEMSLLKYMRTIYQQMEKARDKFTIPQDNVEDAPTNVTPKTGGEHIDADWVPTPETAVDY